jgi:23S rRNA (pseudouridine1915-N3)-methyltransferase
MRLRVLWFGRPQRSPFEEQVEAFRRRVSRRWPAEDVALRPVAQGRDQDPVRVLQLEAERIRQHLPERWLTVVLDERGQALSSDGFARLLGDAEEGTAPGLVAVIGSDLGLDPGLRSQAWLRLSLSPMTLPHLIARLLLWEQLFRATDILRGGAYHRRGVQ